MADRRCRRTPEPVVDRVEGDDRAANEGSSLVPALAPPMDSLQLIKNNRLPRTEPQVPLDPRLYPFTHALAALLLADLLKFPPTSS